MLHLGSTPEWRLSAALRQCHAPPHVDRAALSAWTHKGWHDTWYILRHRLPRHHSLSPLRFRRQRQWIIHPTMMQAATRPTPKAMKPTAFERRLSSLSVSLAGAAV